ncbi:probable serine/threonine-protein kinase kinX [Cotesia glomerata]|uniref:Lipocalin/cytosolic fatty-acid binding domain-containing protein n=1 Tax=Cotesia glomerata TaxID=32391 RepID=A0AAV7J3V1_COTGL|nr:probable serine/threonine-protein kinase kinX [Cotesia glomerata]KAH0567330.1 hypothetical protein KQX54_008440 [Cotesia glomerata]
MLKKILLVAFALTAVRAQVPSLGWCPDYVPMANFDIGKFLGTWYEAERYFQLSEVVSRCVMANYSRGHDNKLRVSNEVTNRFTGIKRVLEGEIKPAASKAEEGKLHIRYTTVPLTPETNYVILETDYKNFAVLWNCNGIGPFHTQNAWIMTRARIPPGDVLQQAYGVLDKYKISKTFFVKTDQEDCAFLDSLGSTEKPIAPPQSDIPVEEAPQQLRSAITPDKTHVNKIKDTEKKVEEPVEKIEPTVNVKAVKTDAPEKIEEGKEDEEKKIIADKKEAIVIKEVKDEPTDKESEDKITPVKVPEVIYKKSAEKNEEKEKEEKIIEKEENNTEKAEAIAAEIPKLEPVAETPDSKPEEQAPNSQADTPKEELKNENKV